MHKAKVIILNTDTILFSFHPDSSKWWCIGVILKILFPVFLKYLTWIITDIVSITGTNGKSTITQLIAQWLSFGFDAKCAVLGTLTLQVLYPTRSK